MEDTYHYDLIVNNSIMYFVNNVIDLTPTLGYALHMHDIIIIIPFTILKLCIIYCNLHIHQ